MAQVLDAPPRPAAAGFSPSASPTVALFLISILGLFLELLLIRWVSTEIRIFAYLQNTVLVVCILGLGMGCWDCRKPFALRDLLLPVVGLIGLLSVPLTRDFLARISGMFNGFSDLLVWEDGEKSGWQAIGAPAIGLILTLVLMVLIWDTFVPVGRLLGRLLNDHPRTLWAYSVNIAGSLVGVWLFVALSGAGLPPVAWLAVFVAMALPFAGTGGRSKNWDLMLLAAALGFGALAGWAPGWQEVYWSPYQKLMVRQSDPANPREGELGVCQVSVNNTSYQEIVDLRPEVVAADPGRYPPALRGLSQYDLPSLLHPSPRSVLVVGAGSGNDVAGALRNGAERVVAVEIDPVIIDVGRRYHPEKPYADPRVEVVIDDARSYFATSTEKFDVVVFGLLDSHTTTAMTNARLDHYVYTRESIRHAASLLKPGGIAALSFYVQRPFVGDRMAGTLREVFGQEPIMFSIQATAYGRGGMIFVAGDLDAARAQMAANPRLAERIKSGAVGEPSYTTPMATDDWPYIYLERPQVPVLYFLLAGVLAVLFARGVRKLKAPIVRGWGRPHTHFFFLGAAFMLLEVQNVSKAAVVLGNTWVVNAVIISGVLGMILVANFVTAKLPDLPPGPVYGLLVASCLGLYFLDLSTFAFLPYATKAVIVGGLTSLPMLFSGVVFARSFAAADRKDAALGANLFGSLVGALLQTVTFVVGVKALLLIVAGLYVAALLTRPRADAEPRELPGPAVA
jgi:spermidine synthase